MSLATDAGGGLVFERRFLPYGDTRWQEGALPTDFTFTGQRAQPGLGLIFMHARYYHPALGRFVSADTIVPEAGNPQDFNRYAYARGNPLAYVDPSGHFVILPAIALIAVIAGGGAIVDWSFQVSNNMYNQGMSFWDAAYHENLNEGEMVQAAAVAGGTAAAVVTAGPALVTAAGQSLMGAGMATGSTALWTAGTSTAAAGTAAYAALWTVDQAASQGTFVGYHGTSSEHESSIRSGIRPPTGLNFGGDFQLGEGFYTTTDYETAQQFARYTADRVGGAPTVLEIYARGFNQMQGVEVPPRLWWRISSDSPYITEFDYLTAPISGLEYAPQIKLNPRVYDALTAR